MRYEAVSCDVPTSDDLCVKCLCLSKESLSFALAAVVHWRPVPGLDGVEGGGDGVVNSDWVVGCWAAVPFGDTVSLH